jgi:hypothetical protein
MSRCSLQHSIDIRARFKRQQMNGWLLKWRMLENTHCTAAANVNCFINTVHSRLSARGLTALRLNRGNVFLKKTFYFP